MPPTFMLDRAFIEEQTLERAINSSVESVCINNREPVDLSIYDNHRWLINLLIKFNVDARRLLYPEMFP